MSRVRSRSEEDKYWYNKKCDYEEYERECEGYEYECEGERKEREDHEREKAIFLQKSITPQDSSINHHNTEGEQHAYGDFKKDADKKDKKANDKIEKDYNRATIEASYAKKMLKWHKRNLYDALQDGEEKIDTIIDLEEIVKEQEVIFDKCYKEKYDILHTINEKQQTHSSPHHYHISHNKTFV